MNAIISMLFDRLPDLINLAVLIVVCVLFTRIGDLKDSIDKRFDDMNKRFHDLKESINKRFHDMNKRIDDVNKRIDDQKDDIKALGQKVDTLSGQVHRIEGHLGLPSASSDG